MTEQTSKRIQLRKWRKMLGLTQFDVARMAGTHVSRISEYERGYIQLKEKQFKKLEAGLLRAIAKHSAEITCALPTTGDQRQQAIAEQ